MDKQTVGIALIGILLAVAITTSMNSGFAAPTCTDKVKTIYASDLTKMEKDLNTFLKDKVNVKDIQYVNLGRNTAFLVWYCE